MLDIQERIAIERPSDFADGGGMGVKIKSIGLQKVRSLTENFIDSGAISTEVEAHIKPTFVFDAGYSITAEYVAIFTNDIPSISELNQHFKLVDCGACSIDMRYDNSSGDPKQIWSLAVTDPNTLKEILSASNEWFEIDCAMLSVGENFGMSHNEACSEFCHQLESNIQLRKQPPNKSAFTQSVVEEFHKRLRCEVLAVLSENN